MAVCVSLMMGRVGSVVGANLVGILLDNYCEFVFSSSGAFLIGTFGIKTAASHERENKIFLLHLFPACGVLAFFIPNIQKRIEPRFLEPRASISSRVH